MCALNSAVAGVLGFECLGCLRRERSRQQQRTQNVREAALTSVRVTSGQRSGARASERARHETGGRNAGHRPHAMRRCLEKRRAGGFPVRSRPFEVSLNSKTAAAQSMHHVCVLRLQRRRRDSGKLTLGVWRNSHLVSGETHIRCLEKLTFGVWRNSHSVSGETHIRCLEKRTFSVWRNSHQVSGETPIRCLEKLTSGVWRNSHSVFGETHIRCLEKLTSGVWRNSHSVFGECNALDYR